LRTSLEAAAQEVFLNVPPQHLEASRVWIASVFDSVARLERVVDDIDDVRYAVSMRYVSLKATWIEYNTIINYETVKLGEADEAMMYLAGTISVILGAIEKFVDENAISRITTLLADPMKEGA